MGQYHHDNRYCIAGIRGHGGNESAIAGGYRGGNKRVVKVEDGQADSVGTVDGVMTSKGKRVVDRMLASYYDMTDEEHVKAERRTALALKRVIKKYGIKKISLDGEW